LSIIERLASQVSFIVLINRNPKQLGYGLNFQEATRRCTGDLMFLSDQDDIWHPEKIAKVKKVFEGAPGNWLVMSDARIVHSDGTPTGLTKLGQTLSLGLDERHFCTGCCMAVSSELAALADPLPSDVFAHDTWINHLATYAGRKIVMRDTLQDYRRHGANTSDWIAAKTSHVGVLDLCQLYGRMDSAEAGRLRQKQLEQIDGRFKLALASSPNGAELDSDLKCAIDKVKVESEAVSTRLSILSNRRSRRALMATTFFARGGYAHFSGWKSYAKDLLRS